MKVITYATSVQPPIIHLNDTDNFAASHTITIENRSDKPVTYNITHEVGSTARSREFADAYIEYKTLLKDNEGLATVKFSAEEIVIPAEGQATFTATFTEPNDVDPMVLAQYGGAIYVVGDNGESVKVNYIGMCAGYLISLKENADTRAQVSMALSRRLRSGRRSTACLSSTSMRRARRSSPTATSSPIPSSRSPTTTTCGPAASTALT